MDASKSTPAAATDAPTDATPGAAAISAGNLYKNADGRDGDPEKFSALVRDGDVVVERIVSYGGATEWYDQDTVEFVTLLQGSACLKFEGEEGERELKRGDYLTIPKHTRHRVTRTQQGAPTIWLAFHWK